MATNVGTFFVTITRQKKSATKQEAFERAVRFSVRTKPCECEYFCHCPEYHSYYGRVEDLPKVMDQLTAFPHNGERVVLQSLIGIDQLPQE